MPGEVTVSVEDLKKVLGQTIIHEHSKIYDYGYPPDKANKECVECAARKRLMQAVTPPIPAEPSERTVLAGTGGAVWQRLDRTGDEYRWWLAYRSDPVTWPDALYEGADPNRRLIVVPDSNDRALVQHIVDFISQYWGHPIERDEYSGVVTDILDELGKWQ